MRAQKKLQQRKTRRGFRVHNRIRRDSQGRPRLAVFRSNRHIYCQIIDDVAGKTLVAASTMESTIAGPGKVASNIAAATAVGELIAKRAAEKGIDQVVFDRGAFRYHGRIAALADAARGQGLNF